MNKKQIMIIAAIVVVGIGALLLFDMKKENSIASTKHYTWLADMEHDILRNETLPDMVDMLRKRVPVVITFQGVDARKGDFRKVFSTEHICAEMETKEERRRWWNLEGKKLLDIAQQEFADWKVDKTPFRYYAIAIDITEGWDGKFEAEELLGEEFVKWIEAEKDFFLDIFSIGFNEVPGLRTIRQGSNQKLTIEDIEKTAKTFLSQAPRTMPETQLLRQLNHIFKKQKYFRIVCQTDLMEFTKQFNAYRYTKADHIDFHDYFITDRGIIPREVVIKVERSNIVGINARRQAWYETFEEQIQEVFPETVFRFE